MNAVSDVGGLWRCTHCIHLAMPYPYAAPHTPPVAWLYLASLCHLVMCGWGLPKSCSQCMHGGNVYHVYGGNVYAWGQCVSPASVCMGAMCITCIMCLMNVICGMCGMCSMCGVRGMAGSRDMGDMRGWGSPTPYSQGRALWVSLVGFGPSRRLEGGSALRGKSSV